jgi:diaminohydroxyphosphoribosylaminopyrimidine deaminase/5-amino-6-(5-phosphoribosylamino)uracil reductase
MKRQRPYIVVKCAQTIDGKTATSGGDSKWITSAATRKFARSQRDRFDAILIGYNTLKSDDPRLSGVTNGGLKKIVLDTKLRTPLKARIFRNTPAFHCILATGRGVSSKKVDMLRRRGVKVVKCPLTAKGIDLKWLFRELGKDGIRSVLIEGGAHVAGSAIAQGVVDELHVFIAPKILGDQHALSSIVGRRVSLISDTIGIRIYSVKRIGKDLLVKSHVHRHR